MNSIDWDFSQHPDPDYDYDTWLYSTYDPDEVPNEEGFDCGWIPGEGCLQAGSEECDWECPYHRQYLREVYGVDQPVDT